MDLPADKRNKQTDQTDRPDRQTQTDRPDRQTQTAKQTDTQTSQTDQPDKHRLASRQTDRHTDYKAMSYHVDHGFYISYPHMCTYSSCTHVHTTNKNGMQWIPCWLSLMQVREVTYSTMGVSQVREVTYSTVGVSSEYCHHIKTHPCNLVGQKISHYSRPLLVQGVIIWTVANPNGFWSNCTIINYILQCKLLSKMSSVQRDDASYWSVAKTSDHFGNQLCTPLSVSQSSSDL